MNRLFPASPVVAAMETKGGFFAVEGFPHEHFQSPLKLQMEVSD